MPSLRRVFGAVLVALPFVAAFSVLVVDIGWFWTGVVLAGVVVSLACVLGGLALIASGGRRG